MQVFDMVVAIVALSILGSIVTKYLKLKTKQTDQEGTLTQEVTDLKRQQAVMEKRIQVLEAIVSSDGYDLKQRFKEFEK